LINAFHPDYIKTHEPKFMDEFRTHEARRAAAETLTKYVEKKRKKNPLHGFVHGIKKPIKEGRAMTMLEVHNEMIKVKPFHIYSKA
jgi:hypothetical protein